MSSVILESLLCVSCGSPKAEHLASSTIMIDDAKLDEQFRSSLLTTDAAANSSTLELPASSLQSSLLQFDASTASQSAAVSIDEQNNQVQPTFQELNAGSSDPTVLGVSTRDAQSKLQVANSSRQLLSGGSKRFSLFNFDIDSVGSNGTVFTVNERINRLKNVGRTFSQKQEKMALISNYAKIKKGSDEDEVKYFHCLDCDVDVSDEQYFRCLAQHPAHFCEVIHKPIEVFSWTEHSSIEADIKIHKYEDDAELYDLLFNAEHALFPLNSPIHRDSPDLKLRHNAPSTVHWVNFDGYATYEVNSFFIYCIGNLLLYIF